MSGALRLAPLRWPDAAMSLGFMPSPGGRCVRAGKALRPDGGWLTLVGRHAPGEPPGGLLGRPGLWRRLPGPISGRGCGALELQFDIPPLLDPEAEESALGDLLKWAEATGDRPSLVHRGPAPDEVEGWVDPARRQLRVGAQLARVEIVATPERLALSIPRLVPIPAQLPPARRAWIEALCVDTQQRWRMARLGVDAAGAGVCAEVDLSGAPPALVRPLVELGLAALTRAATWALPSLAALADPELHSRLLDPMPGRRPPRSAKRSGRKNPNTKERA